MNEREYLDEKLNMRDIMFLTRIAKGGHSAVFDKAFDAKSILNLTLANIHEWVALKTDKELISIK